MNNCPCCSSSMLRHIEHNRVYWYCPHCHQEMPNFAFSLPPLKSRSSVTSSRVLKGATTEAGRRLTLGLTQKLGFS